jgi:hypothetical protein
MCLHECAGVFRVVAFLAGCGFSRLAVVWLFLVGVGESPGVGATWVGFSKKKYYWAGSAGTVCTWARQVRSEERSPCFGDVKVRSGEGFGDVVA